MAPETTILKTIHGSHLYGLARENSDLDTYEVFIGGDKRRAEQRLDGQDDIVRIHLDRFLDQVNKGVPQALETLFSPQADKHPEWAPYLNSLRPSLDQARATYRRTIYNFAFRHGGRTGAALDRAKATERLKIRRHALRLAVNLHELMVAGRFNPSFSSDQANWLTDVAGGDDKTYEHVVTLLLDKAQSGMS